MKMLLNFHHAELRKHGIRTYKASKRKPFDEATMARNLAEFRAGLDDWDD